MKEIGSVRECGLDRERVKVRVRVRVRDLEI